MVGVLQLGVGQGRLAFGAPVDRLQPAVDALLLHERSEGLQHRGLVLRVHREIGTLPVAPDPEAAELLALDADEVAGGLGGARPQLHGVDLMAVEVKAADGGDLGRQAVVVPAGHERAVEAPHGLVLDDHVLQDLVERLAEVDVAVREGRAVVQDVLGAALSVVLNGPIEVDLLPEPLEAGLHLAEVGPHGEIGFREVQGLPVVAGCGHHATSSR